MHELLDRILETKVKLEVVVLKVQTDVPGPHQLRWPRWPVLTTLESSPWIVLMVNCTLDGFFLQTDKHTSCLSHLMHDCPTLPTFLLYLPQLSPMLISAMQPLALSMDWLLQSIASPPRLYSPHLLLATQIFELSHCACTYSTYFCTLLHFVMLFTLLRNTWYMKPLYNSFLYHSSKPVFRHLGMSLSIPSPEYTLYISKAKRRVLWVS